MIVREGGHNTPSLRRTEPGDTSFTPPPDFAVAPVDRPNRPEPAKAPPMDEAEQTAFFHRALELMNKLDNVADHDGLIMNIQLWVTGGHTATAEWYQKIGERLRSAVFIEDLPDLTDEQRSAVTEFMKRAELEFGQRPKKDARPARRVGWRKRIFGGQ